MKAHRAESEDKYAYIKSSRTAKSRLDLNDLLRRVEDQKKDDKRANLLILSGAASVAIVVFLILNL